MKAGLLLTNLVIVLFIYFVALLGLNALVSANAVEGTILTGTSDGETTSDLGCDLDYAGSAIRCKQTALDHIARAVSVLASSTPGPLSAYNSSSGGGFPKEMDIVRCDVQTLPNLFARFNASLERIRVAHSQVQFVAVNAFRGLEFRLRVLDLSGNLLRNVPLAVHTLVVLETLDLRDNHIGTIGDPSGGVPFRNAVNLRQLLLSSNVLGVEEAVGGGTVVGLGLSSLLTKQVHRLTMDQSVFDVGRATHTLELLDISDNGLLTVPDQLRTNFSRLRTLLLGNNKISDFPADVFTAIPELQFLTLDSNLVRTLKFTSLPPNLKLFSLQDNPLQCDCGIMWLLDLVRRNSYLTLQLPPCNTPFYLRDITVSHLNDDRLCNPGGNADNGVHAVYVTDRDLASFHLGLFQALHLLDVVAEVNALSVSWKVDRDFYAAKLNWSVIFRLQDGGIYDFNATQFTLGNYRRQQPNWEPGEGIYTDSIRNLSAPAVHVICIAAVDNSVHYVHLNHCRGATTLKKITINNTCIPVTTASSTMTSSTIPSTTPSNNITQSRLEDLHFTVKGKPSRRSINFTWTLHDPPDKRSHWKESTETVTSRRFQSPLALDALFTRREYLWRITVRPFASTNSSENIVAQPVNDDRIHHYWYTVGDLLPGTAYSICFRLESLPETLKSSQQATKKETDDPMQKCLEYITEKEVPFPVAPVATATVVSITLTAIIMALVCCCLPRRYFKGERLGAPSVEEDDEDDSDDTKGVINRGFLRPQHLVARKVGMEGVSSSTDTVRPRGSLGQLPPAVIKMLEQKRRMLNKSGESLDDNQEIISNHNDEKEEKEEIKSTVLPMENGKVSNGCVVHLNENIEKLQPISNNNNNINNNNNVDDNTNKNTVAYNKLNESIQYNNTSEGIQSSQPNGNVRNLNLSKDCNDNQLPKNEIPTIIIGNNE